MIALGLLRILQSSALKIAQTKKRSSKLGVFFLVIYLCVIALGFEPRTVCLEGRCSIQLSYATGPNVCKSPGGSFTVRGQMVRWLLMNVKSNVRMFLTFLAKESPGSAVASTPRRDRCHTSLRCCAR